MSNADRHLDGEEDSEAPEALLSALGVIAIAALFAVLAYLAPPPASRGGPDVVMTNAAPNNVIARYHVPIRTEADNSPPTWNHLMVALNLSQNQLDDLMAAYDRRRQATTQTTPEDPLPEGETIEIPLE